MINHISQDSLVSLSKIIKRYSQTNNLFDQQFDSNSAFSSLQYNIVPALVEIFLSGSLTFLKDTDLKKSIKQYNSTQDDKINFEELLKKGWIRLINNEIRVAKKIYSLGKNGSNRSDLELTEQDSKELDFIKWLPINLDKNVFIDQTNISQILDKYKIPVDHLINNSVVISNENGTFKWNNSSRLIANFEQEITALLWSKLEVENNGLESFKKFIKYRLHIINRFPVIQNKYFNRNQKKLLVTLVDELLTNEGDLIDIGFENHKIFLDGHATHYPNLDVSELKINKEDAYTIYKSYDEFPGSLQNDIIIQDSRIEYSLAIRFLILNDSIQLDETRKLLNHLDKPYVVYKILYQLKGYRAHSIPYLMIDEKNFALAFYLINGLGFEAEKPGAFENSNSLIQDSISKLNSFLLLLFEEILNAISYLAYQNNIGNSATQITRIFLLLSKNTFKFNRNVYDQSLTIHTLSKELYSDCLRIFQNQKVNLKNPTKDFNSLFQLLGHDLVNNISIELQQFKSISSIIILPVYLIDLSIEILKISSLHKTTVPNGFDDKKIKRKILSTILKRFGKIYKIKSPKKLQYSGKTSFINTSFQVDEFGIEVIDWGAFCVQLYNFDKLESFYKYFSSKNFDNKISDGVYSNTNLGEAKKLIINFKILMIGYLQLTKNNNTYYVSNRPGTIATIKKILFEQIKYYALHYNSDIHLSNGYLDIFNFRYFHLTGNPYYKPLLDLFMGIINGLEDISESKEILNDFFKNNRDLVRLLKTSNLIKHPDLKVTINSLIDKQNVSEFDTIWRPELENALVESVNSDDHYLKAEEFLKRLESQMKNTSGFHKEEKQDFIYRVKLLIALRKKDLETIKNLEYPKIRNFYYNHQHQITNIKEHYIALYHINIDNDFKRGIEILMELVITEPENINYQFDLYEAKTLNAVKENTIIQTSIEIRNEWEKAKREELPEFKNDNLKTIELIHACSQKNTILFDTLINEVSKTYLEEIDVVILFCDFYTERQLPEMAYNLVESAINHNSQFKKPLDNFLSIKSSYESPKLASKINKALQSLNNISREFVPLSIPDKQNNYNTIDFFILFEIIKAVKLMQTKIVAVESIRNENNYNDIISSILRNRITLWGWDVKQEERSGKSYSNDGIGKNAGEVDYTITDSNEDIAMIEAFRLKNIERGNIQKHLKKLYTYNKNLNEYYVLIFFKGRNGYDQRVWDGYLGEVENTNFPKQLAIDKTKLTEDLSNKFKNIKSIKVARTFHKNGSKIYHLMADLT
ncbi:hypothetical protein [Aquimarina sp. MMG016]|uniref:hypothetical protein n=1 Tax=Aquimarina sp. MMG016 TaxID=2822690 RepID=UPI001B3A2985|nr:hypothetical protein [Aquimarina sp. MMG016]MBQ4818889.1 hypothetical protein [Aquimarina sp. MMG016]